ncbi:tail assembly protein [Pseudomonas cannabina]|uniref:Tail assembly protein n=1 Tax=Pseudomonas syringae pv. maculicola str. ES4326 TaxID=629265 RepID=A0A8T8C5T8_PSEYM|nr:MULTISPECIES: tail assembly protein [Pseudomonas syringae group]QHE98980.1 tail assembly protein [Pseudomonas syringae pv. maculicola str. ES4326]QQN21240.1 tail assembly protein [Pseudomonas cannabina pv. alisalensis]UBY99642.1 tail assembly protein [Pseudomonas cannabina pv. alisalensis]
MTAIHYSPMTTIKLSGSLAKKFGRTHRRQIDSGQSQEVFRALNATLEGFSEEIARLDKLGMRFAIFRNRKNVGVDALAIGGTREIRIVPVIGGSKRGGILQTVIGAVLIAVGAYTGQAWMVQTGAALAIGGVIQMLSPQASGLKQSASPENLPSYAFGSAKNTTASGNPVPICIGERRWGGAIISASIYAEDKT